MRRVPFAPEGWLFLIPVLILTAVALLIQWTIAAIVLGLLAIFMINFFRDPHRLGSEHHVDRRVREFDRGAQPVAAPCKSFVCDLDHASRPMAPVIIHP